MTLEMLQDVQKTLNAQLQMLLTTPNEKPVIQHCNAIELLGAIQCCTQLIQQEQAILLAPPGATGPTI